jgi:hypothetical protein
MMSEGRREPFLINVTDDQNRKKVSSVPLDPNYNTSETTFDTFDTFGSSDTFDIPDAASPSTLSGRRQNSCWCRRCLQHCCVERTTCLDRLDSADMLYCVVLVAATTITVAALSIVVVFAHIGAANATAINESLHQ